MGFEGLVLCELIRQTEKAYFVNVQNRYGYDLEIWMPKSQTTLIEIEDQDGEMVDEYINVPDWIATKYRLSSGDTIINRIPSNWNVVIR
jgi:hypothetical protein